MSAGRVPTLPSRLAGAPTTSKYLVQIADASLPNAQAMGALATGLLKNATGTGVQSIAVPGADYETGVAMAYYKALAISRLGLTAGDKNYGFLWDDFTQATNSGPVGWQNTAVGSGSQTATITGTKGGVHRLASSGTAGGGEDSTQISCLIANVSTDKWWLGFRQQISAVTAQVRAVTGLYDTGNAKSVSLGAWGTGSGGGGTTNWTLQYDGNLAGTFVDTGVAITTGAQIFFELYGKGDSKVYYRIAEGGEASVTPAAASTLSQIILTSLRNGTDNVNYNLDRDFVACLFPR